MFYILKTCINGIVLGIRFNNVNIKRYIYFVLFISYNWQFIYMCIYRQVFKRKQWSKFMEL